MEVVIGDLSARPVSKTCPTAVSVRVCVEGLIGRGPFCFVPVHRSLLPSALMDRQHFVGWSTGQQPRWITSVSVLC